MAEQKFHINKNGDVKECKADVRACRFGGDSQHFTDEATAWEAAEAQTKADNPDEFGTLTRKVNTSSETKDPYVDETLKTLITTMASQKFMSPTDLQNIGKVFEKEFENKLSFNPWDHELSFEELCEVKKVNRELFSSLVKNGGDIPVPATGPLSQQLNEAVKILPDNLKEFSRNKPLNAKYIHGNTRLRLGQYNDSTPVSTRVPAVQYLGEEFSSVAPKNSIVVNYKSLDEVKNAWGGERFPLNKGDGPTFPTVWLGVPPSKHGYKKISDTAEVFVQGELVTIDKPVYAISDLKRTFTAEITMQKGVNENHNASVLLHEYCHYLQFSGLRRKAEVEMFNEIAGEEKKSSSYGVQVNSGFPNEYMGASNKLELLPVSTEGLFNPESGNNDFLYGSDRGENADKVRQWVIGFWLSQANKEPRKRNDS